MRHGMPLCQDFAGGARTVGHLGCLQSGEVGQIRNRRVEYDVGATVRKIHAVPNRDRTLGDHLRDGR